MTPIWTAPLMEPICHTPAFDDIPIQEEPFDVSEISTSSRTVSSRKAKEIFSDVGTLYFDESWQNSLHRAYTLRIRHQEDRRKNWSKDCLCANNGKYCNPAVEPAINPAADKRLQETELIPTFTFNSFI